MAFLHHAPLLEPFSLFPSLFSPLFPVCTSPLSSPADNLHLSSGEDQVGE